MKRVVKIQLLSSSSVAVSTSQDFDDNATITAFWEEKQKNLSETFPFYSTAELGGAMRSRGGKKVEEY